MTFIQIRYRKLNYSYLKKQCCNNISSLCAIRDRFRTCVNVMGDALGSGIVDHLSRDDIMFSDQLDANEDTPLKHNGGALDGDVDEEDEEDDDPMKMTSV